MKLRDYQRDCLDSIQQAYDRGIQRQMIVIATGGGKTVIASNVINMFSGRVLFLAHRKELLQKTAETFSIVHPEKKIQIEQAENHADPDADIVVASTATLGNAASDRIFKFDPDHFDLIFADEAHRSVTSTWEKILNYFSPKLLLGMTATPQRTDNVGLYNVFDEITYYKPMRDLIKDGYLVDFVGYRISTGVDITGVSTSGGDYTISALSEAINTPERNRLAVDAYLEFANGLKTIAFTADVKHAVDLHKAFVDAGVSAAYVVGETPSEKRSDLLKAFSEGSIKVLIGVNIFVEGYDEPSIRCVLWARPTKSPLFFTQGVGRGARLHESKDHCIFLDLCDVSSRTKPMGLPTLMGLPADFETEGKTLTELADKYDELMDKLPDEAVRVRSLEDIEKAWERFDIFVPAPISQEVAEYTNFVWSEVSQDKYVLNLGNNEYFKIELNVIDKSDVFWKAPDAEKYTKIGSAQDLRTAFMRVDKWIMENRSERLKLIDSTEPWHNEPPTESQLKYLKKYEIPIPSDITRGQASQILDRVFQKYPKKEKPLWLERKIARNKSRW